MAFTVEDGTGVADANAYIDIDFADSYFTDRAITEWAGTDSVKQASIIKATDYVEVNNSLNFIGIKADEDQGLSWPRTDAVTASGVTLTGVPTELKKAVAEYALRALTTALLPDPTSSTSGRAIIKEREKIGPIETETEYSAEGGTTLTKAYPAADRLLEGLVEGGAIAYR